MLFSTVFTGSVLTVLVSATVLLYILSGHFGIFGPAIKRRNPHHALQSSRVSLNTLSKGYTGALRTQSWRERHDCSGVPITRVIASASAPERQIRENFKLFSLPKPGSLILKSRLYFNVLVHSITEYSIKLY